VLRHVTEQGHYDPVRKVTSRNERENNNTEKYSKHKKKKKKKKDKHP
jgi:hypothetical protein